MNWGQSFVNGLSTGHSVTQSLIDKYREQEAQRELIGVLEGLKDKQPASGQASALEGSVNLNGIGKEGAINTDTTPEKGWMDSTTSENLGKIAAARGKVDTAIGGVLDQLGTPRTFEINGVPVEDRSTEYRRNVVLPTDTGTKTVRNSFTVGGVPVEDASTPHYTNEMVRQSVEGQAQKPKARAITVKPGTSAAQPKRQSSSGKPAAAPKDNVSTFYDEYLGKSPARSAQPSRQSTQTPQTRGDANAALQRYLATNAPQPKQNPLHERTVRFRPDGATTDGGLPVSYSYRAGQDEVPARFAKEEQIARNRRQAEQVAQERAALNQAGGGPVRPADTPTGASSVKGDPVANFYADYTGRAPDEISVSGPGDRAIQLPEGTVLGQIQTQDGRTLDVRNSGGDRAIQLQPGSGNTSIGGQGNSYTDMNYRARQRQIMMAEAKYLLRVDPRAGIAAMKQINQQDAQWELSDMYRGAMQGDPTSLGKIVQFMNIGNQGGEITVSEDGRYAVVTDANGNKTQNIPITPQLIMQTLPMVQATFMTMNGMATDKAIELMQSMMTTGLQQDKLRSEIARNNAYTGFLDARAQGASAPQGLKLFATTDAEGNPILVDQNTQRIYDQGSGVLLPHGFTAGRMAEVRAKYGDDARLGTAPDGRDVVGTADGKIIDLATGEQINPNQPTATSAKEESGDADSVSLAAGMIKGLEGFQAEPYSDYTQTSIGYGTRANEGEKSITEAEASQRLMDHIQTEITPKLDKALASAKVGLTPEQKASLISLCYNVGTDRFLRSSAFQALKGGDIKRFVAEVSDPERGFTKTRTAMGGLQVNPGLVERRRKEMEPFLA